MNYADFANVAIFGFVLIGLFVLLGGTPLGMLFWMGVVVAVAVWRVFR